MDRVDCVVVGAGVVGLAVARALALAGREVLVLEAEAAFGTATSARNSEVIHAGIYYPQGSLKGRLCVAGRRLLYDFCESHGVAHRRCGKLIVATDEAQLGALEQLQRHAQANGVDDLQRLDRSEVLALEPQVQAVAGLFSPSTGIVDSHALMLALLGDAERHGAVLALNTPVEGIAVTSEGLHVHIGGADPLELLARTVINCAGHGAPALATRTQHLSEAARPRQYFAKGSYFSQTGRTPFRHLVYPLPEPGGLGVHLTLDLGGQARFGPDVEWVDGLDYTMDESRAERFYAAIRRYWPGLPDGALQPAYTGIRPKISGPGEQAADFCIDGPAEHGIAGLVNLFGIESPGLTAALAIADEVCRRLAEGARAG
ncbi:FAD-dependent oxidoreductase [Stutzerimonas stutzeri]|uniref:FAD-dependent oxidoreductase n=1 Tax=Stutzerimonas stutzeri TaxID=316 RepID=A0A2S4AKZ8_STUST|nr:NAD(P)/FAD-dependent oxidoreductase [Stutzerimonas stutzeri]MCQ4264049.1 NAD(P)/FAD-dependent oxidoreductase [Stutzerimonas stutzeri]POH82059.1 FAD-dependent oxidoreductase [Stutzerimonas stutzeri]